MSLPSPTDSPVTARPSLGSRALALLSHPERSAALLAILIGFASVFSAVIAWRASLAAIDGSRYESLAVQQQARRQQIERELGGLVEQDQRFVTIYLEHALAARRLNEQADAIRSTDPEAADVLDLESQARLALARNTLRFFLGAGGIELSDDDTVAYDEEFVLRNLREANVELRELETAPTLALAHRADERALNFIGVAAVIIAALFFLTVAQVSHARVRVRQLFFVAGGLLVLVGTIGFLFVEFAT